MNFKFLILLAYYIILVLCEETKQTKQTEQTVQSEDCKKINSFLDPYRKLIQKEYPPCCGNWRNNYIKCDEKGQITDMVWRYTSEKQSIDFSTFPVLPKLKSIILEGSMFKDGILPNEVFKQPSLENLEIVNSNVKTIPSVTQSCRIQKLDLYNNEIESFPSSIINCSKINTLDLSYNDIGTIPSDISKLTNLRVLYIGMSNVKSIPKSIFDMNFDTIDLNGNPNLKTKIYNFASKVKECDFRETDIICYQPGSCEKLIIGENNGTVQYSTDFESYFKICDGGVMSKKSGSKIPLIVSLLIIMIFLASLCCFYIIFLKRKNKNSENENSNDVIVTPVVIKGASNENNSSNNENNSNSENNNNENNNNV